MKQSLGAAISNGVLGARLLARAATTPTTTTAAASSATPSCPAANGITYAVPSGGSSFVVECAVDRMGNDLNWVYTASFAACMAQCSKTAGCVDVSWVPGNPGPCYMKSAHGVGSSNSGVWGARMLTTSTSTSIVTSTTTSPVPTTLSTVVSSASSVSVNVNAPTNVPGCGRSLPSGQTPGGSSTSVSFTQSDGTRRSYNVFIPATYNVNAKTPLLYSFHGAGASPGNQEAITGFSTPSVNPNFIVVYPQGYNGFFQGAPYSTPGINDIAFTLELLASLESLYCIDPNRIYASGMSNGGGFTGLLACDAQASTTFAAFGLHSAALYQHVSDANCVAAAVPLAACTPGRTHVPILEIHGSADGQIPYLGGAHNAECMPAVPDWVRAWSVREGYGSANVSTALAGGSMEYQFGSAQGKAGVVTHYMVQGLGHSWATGYNGFSSAPVMMAFFGQWSLPLP